MARTGRSFPAKADAGRVAIMNAAASFVMTVETGSYVITGNAVTLTWSGAPAGILTENPSLLIMGIG